MQGLLPLPLGGIYRESNQTRIQPYKAPVVHRLIAHSFARLENGIFRPFAGFLSRGQKNHQQCCTNQKHPHPICCPLPHLRLFPVDVLRMRSTKSYISNSEGSQGTIWSQLALTETVSG